MTKRVTIFGTCRVFNALRVLKHEGKIVFNNGQFANYLHCMPEILQELQVMNRSYEVPPPLEPYFFNKFLPPEDKRRYPDTRKTDLVICEISTSRSFSYNGVHLQGNFLNGHLVTPKGALLRGWLKAVSEMDEAKRDQEVNAILSTQHELTDLEIDLLKNVKVERQTPEKLRSDILKLRDAFSAPLLLVTHCDVLGNDGVRVPARVSLIESIVEIGAQEGIPVFQPAALIKQYGQTVAMESEGKDINHYHPDFYPILADHLYSHWL